VLGGYAPAPSRKAGCRSIAGGEGLVVLAYQERKARYRLDVCEARP
jgi:hypothetical protein